MNRGKSESSVSRNCRKAESFKRLAEQRTNAVLEKIRILGNCSNRALYFYTDKEVAEVFRAITLELRRTREKFAGGQPQSFVLKENNNGK